MSDYDSYRATYDAVRSRITNGDIGQALREALDFSHTEAIIRQEILNAAYEQQRPFVLLHPQISLDGDQWCALYGSDMMCGVVGFGASPDEASRNFDKSWYERKKEGNG